MGFRDLHAHNLATLAKQGWKIVKNPNSLVSRLLKARYFPSTDFWSAPLLPTLRLVVNVSLRLGLVGNMHDRLHKVCDLINKDRTWNVSLMEEHFEDADVQVILVISLCHMVALDKLI